MPEGKYFRVRSRMSGLVLDVYTGTCAPGQTVCTWDAKGEDNDNQYWRVDPLTNTIRSRADESYCLDVDGDGNLIVNPYSDTDSQRWKVSGDRIQKMSDPNMVLDIAARKTNAGAKVIQYPFHGNDNQLWDFEYLPAEYFFLVSRMHGKVLDVYAACCDDGARVCIWEKKEVPEDNQLWYEDKHGYLRSKLSHMVLDAAGDEICMKTRDTGSDRQRWVLSDGKIVNADRPEELLDIKARCCDNGACVIVWRDNGQDNQRWTVEKI